MLRNTDTYMPTQIPNLMDTIAHCMYQDAREKLVGTYAWDFAKFIGMYKNDDNDYKIKFFNTFNIFYNTKEEATEVSKHIMSTANEDIVCSAGIGLGSKHISNCTKYKFVSLCPVLVRDYASHKNVYALYFKFIGNNKDIYIKMTEKYDLIEPHDDLNVIENFTGLYIDDVAVAGYCLYEKCMQEFKDISFSKNDWTPEQMRIENLRRCEILKNIPKIETILSVKKTTFSGNELECPSWYDIPEYYLPTNHIYAKTTIGEWNKIVHALTVDKHGNYIAPDNSLLGCGGAISLTDHNHGNRFINKEITTVDEKTEIWLEAVGWKRFTGVTGMFLPDGENKKRWQPQLYIFHNDMGTEGWTVESQINYPRINIISHQYLGDPRCTIIDEVKDSEWWVNTMLKLDKDTYNLVWNERESWGKQKRPK